MSGEIYSKIHDYLDEENFSNSDLFKLVDKLEKQYTLHPEDGQEISQILFRCNYHADSPNSVIVGELSRIYYGAQHDNYLYDEHKINEIHNHLVQIKNKAIEKMNLKNKILNLHKKILTDNQINFKIHLYNGIELPYDHPWCGVMYGERP